MRAIVIDDQAEERKSLVNDIQKHCSHVKISATCSGGMEGMQAINKYKPDLIFLDIEMHPMDGITMLNCIGKDNIKFQTVFVTKHSNSDFLLEAIRLNACHYLLKPFTKDQLISAVKRVEDRIKSTESIPPLPSIEHIVLPPEATVRHYFKISEILYFKSDGNFTNVYLTNGEKHHLGMLIKVPTELLQGHSFVRCHHSYLVNKSHIRKYHRPEGYVLLSDNKTKIPVAQSRRGDL